LGFSGVARPHNLEARNQVDRPEGKQAMKAVVVERPGSVKVRDVPEPVAGPKDVVVKVGACGICGTDIHIIDGEFPPTTYPIIIGHEFGGTVVGVGSDVVGVKVGDRVGVDPTLNCGECYFCQRGKGNLCERWNAVGVGAHPGGFAECVAVPERTVYPIPERMSFAAAGLIEPVSCVVHAFHLLRPQPGDSYLVYGAGPMGLQNAQVARYFGARVVAVVDINPDRLEIARSFGFDVVGRSLDDVRHVAPRGFDIVIEATGKTKVAEMAIDAVIRSGKLLLFGVCPPGEKAAYDPFKIYNEEITIIGSMAVLNSYGPAIDLLDAGAVDTARMVTHTFPIDQFDEAVALVRSGQGLKVQIDPAR
jgi:2-desacetyl-2-hydroxyethyl bacteriochlorophyllide A dehydrogenase